MHTRYISKEIVELCKKVNGKIVLYTAMKGTPKEVTFKAIVLANPKIGRKISIKPLATPKHLYKKFKRAGWISVSLKKIEDPTFCFATMEYKKDFIWNIIANYKLNIISIAGNKYTTGYPSCPY